MDQDIPGISLEFPEGSLPSDVGLSDVLEVIEETDPSFAQLQQQPSQLQRQGTLQEAGAAVGIMISGGSMQTRTMPPSQSGPITLDGQPAPWLEIVEQPAGKALRFRYECEGRSAGSIPGTSSTPENKTFPTVRINNYNGRVLVVVSCVTKDAPHRPHPHNLVGKEVCANGICRVEVPKETMTVSFDKLGIQCVKRREIEKSLKLREKQKIDPFGTGYEHMRQPTSIDLNSVRLCFHAWIEGRDHKFRIPLKPVVSDPIYDKKAMSDLMICKLSHCSASVAGGQAMILLCEKVAKDDIEVRFFEERDGYVVWEGKGEFQPTQVHKQVAISLLTPPYRSNHVTSPVNVFIQLRRPSDGATSEALPFTMTPLTPGRPSQLWSLHKALARKKAAYDFAVNFNRVIANDQPRPPSYSLDEFNNNSAFGDSIDELISEKRTQNRLSALQVLNNVQNDQANGLEGEYSHDLTNGNVTMSRKIISNGFVNNQTSIPEKNCQNYEPIENGNDQVKVRSDWFDYTEVDKWVQKTQESNREGIIEENNIFAMDQEVDNLDKSSKELLNQATEIDKIYDETHEKMLHGQQEPQTSHTIVDNGNNMELDVPDNKTYTSLQMAMKNPVWVRSVMNSCEEETAFVGSPILQGPFVTMDSDKAPPRPPPPSARVKRDVLLEEEEGPVPPLPPKRIRKTPSMPVLPLAASNQTLNEQKSSAPDKNLPTLPGGTLPKQNKPGLFSKLFSKKGKKDGKEASSTGDLVSSTISLPGLSKESMFVGNAKFPPVRAMATDAKNFDLEGDETPPYGAELTEAETYALYTTMAPHATASEFDEMSFYYSPVEGGKILVEAKETT